MKGLKNFLKYKVFANCFVFFGLYLFYTLEPEILLAD